MNQIRQNLENSKLQHEEAWHKGYDEFSKIINPRNFKVGAEIGVAYGGHCEAMLKNTKIEKLYGVDPYEHRESYVDDSMNLPQKEFDELFKMTKERLSPFSKRYEHIRKCSKDAVGNISEQLDFIYIDADHSYEGVWTDLCAWFLKIKDGGIIGGHDYMNPYFPGVQKAVDEFFRRFNWKINFDKENMMWWVEKKSLHISFFIPAFNCEETVTESLYSIISTNLEEGDEIVITNDGSTDNTAKILQEFADKYSYVKILTHTRNKGGATARNTAIENTKNEILFCLDSDNILLPNSIEPLKRLLLEKGADCVAFQGTYYFVNDTKEIYKKLNFLFDEVTLERTLGNNSSSPIGMGNYMFTKNSWNRAGGYPDGNWIDTWGFGIRQLFSGTKMYILPNSFYFHRRGHVSYTVREAKEGKTSLTALQLLLPYFEFLSKRSIRYVMGRGKYTWFENLDKKPLKLAKSRHGLQSTQNKIKRSIKKTFPFFYKKYIQIRYGK
ncbi:MAG: glycosyltransferase [Candidatus Paceibacterota bacterium]|jgi:glycosyltransferase involved in cell wall biosynthesis